MTQCWTITNTSTNVELGNWSMPNDAASQVSVSQSVLHGGKQEGSRLIVVKTKDLKVTLIPTRGMGILRIESDDKTLGWQSPIHEIVHPSFMNLESRNGLGWLEGFNELLCRCGLEWSGHPGTDTFVNNVGTKDSMMLTLHGKIANITASFVEIMLDSDAVIVHGRIEERVFHGPKLILDANVRIPFAGTKIQVEDTVTNRGSMPQEFQLLYHWNIGCPLLEEGAKIVANPVTNIPFNERAKEGLETFDTYEKPTPGFVEQVYKMTLKKQSDGKSAVLLHNASKEQGVSLTVDTKELPYFTLWKNTAALEDGYVTGLEPGTCFPHNRSIERSEGRLQKLRPNEERTIRTIIEYHGTRTSIEEKERAIRSTQ